SDAVFTNSEGAAGSDHYGVYFVNSYNNNEKFTGNLWVGNNQNGDCTVVAGSTNPGLVTGTCANNGSSDANLVTGKVLSAAFVGALASTDTTNTSDASGQAAYAVGLDWLNFMNVFRMWGISGSVFPNSNDAGLCSSGTCQIWDWSLSASDSVLLNA